MNLNEIITLGNIAIGLFAVVVALTLIVIYLAAKDHKENHHN